LWFRLGMLESSGYQAARKALLNRVIPAGCASARGRYRSCHERSKPANIPFNLKHLESSASRAHHRRQNVSEPSSNSRCERRWRYVSRNRVPQGARIWVGKYALHIAEGGRISERVAEDRGGGRYFQRLCRCRIAPAIADARHAQQGGSENDFAVPGIADMIERDAGASGSLLRPQHDQFLARPCRDGQRSRMGVWAGRTTRRAESSVRECP